MSKYSLKTILKATDLLADSGHDDLDRFFLEHSLEGFHWVGSVRDRVNLLVRFLLENPLVEEDGVNLTDSSRGRACAQGQHGSTKR
jgi:hypothetical protein